MKKKIESSGKNVSSSSSSDDDGVSAPPIVKEKMLLRQSVPYSAAAALALGWVMIYADRLSISPLLSVIKNEFGLTYLEVSIVVSVYFVTYVGFTIPATIAASRYGFKKVMVLFFFMAALSLAIAGVLGYSYFLLVVFVGLHGVGAGAYYPTAYTISAGIVPKEKVGFSSALINSGMGFGSILGLIVSGFILPFVGNWQVVLFILAVPSALVALLLYKMIPNVETYNWVSTTNILGHYKKVLVKRDFILIASAMFCSLYGYWVILTWGPSFLQESKGLSLLSSGATTAVFAAVAILPSIFIGRHSDKVGRKKISMIIMPLAALSIFFMAYGSSLASFLLSIAAYGVVGKLTLDPITLGWLADITPPELLGPTLALLNVTAMSSSILAPLITGLLADSFGSLAYGFYFGALVVLLGTIFISLVSVERK